MTKREIIKLLRKHLESMPKQSLLNLLDCWDGKTPKLYCESLPNESEYKQENHTWPKPLTTPPGWQPPDDQSEVTTHLDPTNNT